MTDVMFPALSKEQEQADGVVTTWFVADGETVTAGQVLAEVQVEKVAADVSAPRAGTVHLLVPEEAVVKQGQAIARLD